MGAMVSTIWQLPNVFHLEKKTFANVLAAVLCIIPNILAANLGKIKVVQLYMAFLFLWKIFTFNQTVLVNTRILEWLYFEILIIENKIYWRGGSSRNNLKIRALFRNVFFIIFLYISTVYHFNENIWPEVLSAWHSHLCIY